MPLLRRSSATDLTLLSLPCPLVELVPHRTPMLLLDEFEVFTDDHGEAVVMVREGHLFEAENHQLDPAAMIEMIAQSAAAHEGYRRLRDGLALGGGFLAGVRDFEVFGAPRIGDSIRTVATRGLRIGDLQYSHGEIKRGSEVLARGDLLFFLSDELVPNVMPEQVSASTEIEAMTGNIGNIHEALDAACREWSADGGVFVIDSDFPALNGHFPAYPILPAVLNIMMASRCVQRIEGPEWRLSGIQRAKFNQPVLPGSEVVVVCENDKRKGRDLRRAQFFVDDVLAARFSFE